MRSPRFLALAALGGGIDTALRRRLRDALGPPLAKVQGSPGLDVYASRELRMSVLPEGVGFVAGRLFRREARDQLEGIDPELAAEIVATRGQVLIERFWGEYIAIGRDQRGIWALRDPSGAQPLYRSQLGNLVLFFSDPEDSIRSGLLRARLDESFPSHWLAYPALRTARTGLEGVTEVLPGVRWQLANEQAIEEAAWTPWAFSARRSEHTDFEAARSRLRQELARVVPALAYNDEHLLLELSGGLDSALIAAALSNAGRTFAAVNFATRSPDGDERRYAREIAEHFGAPLAELNESETAIDLAVPDVLRLRPAFSPVVQPLHRAFAAYAEKVEAGAFLTGTGGDNVFCYLTTAAPIVDAIRTGRAWRAMTQTLPEVAAHCDCTVWTAARFALVRLLRRPRRLAWKRNVDFLMPDAVPPTPDHHPWLVAPRGALPGKREHVEALVRIQHFLDPANREADIPFLHPLMAQPMLELCLAIPSWMWVQGGRNRAVARAAFEDLLPPSVVNRRTKGRLESMCAHWFVEARDALREIVLDGGLRRQGIIDAAALESYLATEGVPKGELYFRIFELAAVELWLSSWRSRAAT